MTFSHCTDYHYDTHTDSMSISLNCTFCLLPFGLADNEPRFCKCNLNSLQLHLQLLSLLVLVVTVTELVLLLVLLITSSHTDAA